MPDRRIVGDDAARLKLISVAQLTGGYLRRGAVTAKLHSQPEHFRKYYSAVYSAAAGGTKPNSHRCA